MSGGGSFRRQRSRQASESRAGPWAGVQPYLLDIYQQAQQQFQEGPQRYYPGQTVAGFTPIQQEAQQLRAEQARGPAAEEQLISNILQGQATPLNMQQAQQFAGVGGAGIGVDPTARQTLEATARGESLTGNPYLDAQFQRASENVGRRFQEITEPGIAATFGGAGRAGGGIQQQVQAEAQRGLAGELGGLATDIYGRNYEQERQRQLAAAGQLGQLGLGATGLGVQQDIAARRLGADIYGGEQARALQAAGLAPSLAALRGARFGELTDVGAEQQAQRQREIDAQRERYEFGQQAPADALARYAAIIQALQQQEQFARSRGRSSGFGIGGSVGAGGV